MNMNPWYLVIMLCLVDGLLCHELLKTGGYDKMSSKKNLRRVSLVVTAQTLYHLNKLAAMSGYNNLGRVVDKLVREKAVYMNYNGKEQGNHE